MENIKKIIEQHYPDHVLVSITKECFIIRKKDINPNKKDPYKGNERKPLLDLINIMCSKLVSDNSTKKETTVKKTTEPE